MTITASQLNTIVRELYNIVGDPFYSDDLIFNAMFQAEAILAKEGWVIEKTYTTPSVATTRQYAYPTNTLAIREVRYKNDPLIKIPLKYDPKSGTSEPTGTPTNYAIWNQTVFLFPTPSVSADAIQMRCFLYPQRLSATSALNVPDEYQMDLCDYILAQFCLKNGDRMLAGQYMQTWVNTVANAVKNKARIQRSDRSAVVRDTYFSDDFTITSRGCNEYEV